jgi:hypothetical protein
LYTQLTLTSLNNKESISDAGEVDEFIDVEDGEEEKDMERLAPDEVDCS